MAYITAEDIGFVGLDRRADGGQLFFLGRAFEAARDLVDPLHQQHMRGVSLGQDRLANHVRQGRTPSVLEAFHDGVRRDHTPTIQ
jgi:hypothetical protein